MSDTERRYSQIEKEALGLVWSYILGKHIRLETDHKPLILLLSKANLDSLPPRIYDSDFVSQDLITRSVMPLENSCPNSDVTTIDKNIESSVIVLLSHLPASPDRSKGISICSTGRSYLFNSYHLLQTRMAKSTSSSPRLYCILEGSNKLTIINNLLLFSNRIVVPERLRTQTLQKIHYGHHGLQR